MFSHQFIASVDSEGRTQVCFCKFLLRRLTEIRSFLAFVNTLLCFRSWFYFCLRFSVKWLLIALALGMARDSARVGLWSTGLEELCSCLSLGGVEFPCQSTGTGI